MRRTNSGFTLIELMIVVAIVGLLSSFAVPAYRDYVVRAQIAEALQIAGTYKTDMSERIAVTGAVPAQDEDYYIAPASAAVRRVKWSIGRYAIEIWFGSGAGPELDGTILWLIPTLGSGVTQWTCRGHTGAGGAGWKIEAKHLPASCRG